MSSFNALSQLTKHGWTEGSGLGRNEHGMSEAIKVSLKFDQHGIGHDAAEQFTYHWWDHAFNKAANSISVNVEDDKVKVVKGKDYQISARKLHVKESSMGKNMLYGRFVKSGTLTGNEMVEEEKKSEKSDSDSDSDSDSETTGRTTEKLTDEELFKICGGLTAHKGARHGLKASGKLARIMEQERLSTPTQTPSQTPSSSPKRSESSDAESPSKKSKKKKKRKAEEVVEECTAEEPARKKKKSKKSKKEKTESDSVEASDDIPAESDNSSSDSSKESKKKKKKSKKREKRESEIEEIELKTKTKKKKVPTATLR